jgi:hypothetical protein
MPSISFSRLIRAPVSRRLTDTLTGVVEDFGNNWSEGDLRLFSFQKTWVRTPGFFQDIRGRIKRRFDLPMNAYSYYKKVTNFPYGTVVVTTYPPFAPLGPMVDEYSGAVNAVLNLPSFPYSAVEMPACDLDELDNRAKTATLRELKDSKVNLVQAFAERGQTFRLMGNTISRLAGAASSLRRGNFAAAALSLGVKTGPRRVRKYTKSWSKDQSTAVANGWLELQYGWRPLLTDIYGAAEQLAQLNVREVRNIVRKSASVNLSRRMSVPASNQGPNIYVDVKRRVTIKYVIYYSTPQGNHTLTQIGLTNPLLIAWELTPWSFVIDWMLPLGDYISTLDATRNLAFEKGCRTFFEEVTFYSKSRSGLTEPGREFSADYSLDTKEVTISRQSISAFPEVNLPKFKNPLSTTHLLNAIALLTTSLRVK